MGRQLPTLFDKSVFITGLLLHSVIWQALNYVSTVAVLLRWYVDEAGTSASARRISANAEV